MSSLSADDGRPRTDRHPRARSDGRRPQLRETHRISRMESETDDGKMVNQYRLVKTLGTGAFGVVWLAIDNDAGIQLVGAGVLALTWRRRLTRLMQAMKEIDKRRLRKKASFGRVPPGAAAAAAAPQNDIMREIAILKKLDHPNAVRLIEVLEDIQDDYMYLGAHSGCAI